STEIVATAFDAEIAALRRPDDDRPMSRRRAEALVSMFRSYLAARDDGAGPRRGRTHVSLVADIGESIGISDDLLAAARAEAAHASRPPHPHAHARPPPRQAPPAAHPAPPRATHTRPRGDKATPPFQASPLPAVIPTTAPTQSIPRSGPSGQTSTRATARPPAV